MSEWFNGLYLLCVCVLIGVIGIVYESWFNVIVDVVVLCVMVGNVVILCGGLEVVVSNCVIYVVLVEGFVVGGVLVDVV